MNFENTLDNLHARVVRNQWLQRFTVFNRIVLAIAFLPSGLKKILGQPFTVLPVSHPVGYFFDALHQTGGWYEFIGWAQVCAAVLLLFPRTATLGAAIYFPIIVNICVITNAMGFRGTGVLTVFMLLAAMYLICWDYDKFKAILPSFRSPKPETKSTRHDYLFEGALFGALSAGCFAFFAFNGVANLHRVGFVGVLLAFAFGVAFGLFSVWHRRGLRVAT